MIGLIILSMWVFLGLLNVFIWKTAMENTADEVALIFNRDTIMRYYGVILLAFSPYYFTVGIYVKIKQYRSARKIQKLLQKLRDDPSFDFDKHLGGLTEEFFPTKKKK